MKYILVTGGVISGIGKGVIASSIGTILRSHGIRITSIKIDPYINIDAGTFSPYEHGEVFVLDDGSEVDLDLGNYERFLDLTLRRDNNITTGKIYHQVIQCERRGEYLGKTVQVVPHITDAIQDWVTRVAKIPVDGLEGPPDVCIVELGGVIGDIESMPFIEAFRQFQFRITKENIVFIHVSLVPQPKTTGEHKTKPTQSNVRELRGLGISPDLVYCVHDVTSVFRVPLLLEAQGACSFLVQHLNLVLPNPAPRRRMHQWKELAERSDRVLAKVTIALVGKYTKLKDSYISVHKALQHACLSVNRQLNLKYIDAEDLEISNGDACRYHDAWKELVQANGIVVPGGFGCRGTEGMFLAAKWARERKVPFLGVCLGMQCAVIEFARNVLGLVDANSTEFQQDTSHPLIIDMPEYNTDQKGGTMRLGKRTTLFKRSDSIVRKLYADRSSVDERHRHRYEVNPKYVPDLEAKGLQFVGHSEDGERMEIMELKDHPFFIGVQFHPEYLSRPTLPSPPYLGLILASCNKFQHFALHGYRRSMRMSFCVSDSDSVDDDNADSDGDEGLRIPPKEA